MDRSIARENIRRFKEKLAESTDECQRGHVERSPDGSSSAFVGSRLRPADSDRQAANAA
jgi:hypothetical protein